MVIILCTGIILFFCHLNKKLKNINQLQILRINDLEEQNNKSVEQLRSSLSHGMRMPLAIISGYAGILEKSSNLSNEESKYIKKVNENVNHLSQMISFSLNQIKENTFTPECKMEELDISTLIKSIVTSVENILLVKGILVQLNGAEEKILVKADNIMLTNVFHNLFENSIKYMNKSGFINITLSNLDNNKVLIAYKDNGVGMKCDDVIHIFDDAYQGANSNEGEGRGMFIVKNIVEQHNGTIKAVSNLNQGMGIYIELPIL